MPREVDLDVDLVFDADLALDAVLVFDADLDVAPAFVVALDPDLDPVLDVVAEVDVFARPFAADVPPEERVRFVRVAMLAILPTGLGRPGPDRGLGRVPPARYA